ncbi:MAG TPA: cysteine--tRNA ligase [Ktedonobacterales bacterium]
MARKSSPAREPQTPHALRLFNTLTRTVEPVTPLRAGHVSIYTCGPTVYREVHIGNLRSFMMADWIRRTLTLDGLAVRHVKNITDVGHMRQDVLDRGEDKLIAQALKEGKTPWEIAAYYTEAFLRDERRLNILPADVFPRATDHIAEMIRVTGDLLSRDIAYEGNGNIFFSVAKFPDYGALSGNLLELLGAGMHTASELDSYKRAPEDFPLWKAAEPGRLMAWESPWGMGFPGWHIECTAMSIKHLGPQLDIHTGGVDNIFPHHEDERAQSEAWTGLRFARHWVHGQHLLADGLKMAKSTGNAYSLSDVVARGFDPLALRYLFTQVKYRARVNFTFRALRAAQVALDRLREHVAWLVREAGDEVPRGRMLQHARMDEFQVALHDDLNLPRAMATTWAVARDSTMPTATRLGLLTLFDEALGLGLRDYTTEHASRRAAHVSSLASALPVVSDEKSPEALVTLATRRSQARSRHRWKQADSLRARLRAAGWEPRDHRDHTLLVPAIVNERLISHSSEIPSRLDQPDTCAISVCLLAHENHDELERTLASVMRQRGQIDIEVIITDNGSTGQTYRWLRDLDQAGQRDGVPVRVIFADHDMGFAAGRNAALRAAGGRLIVVLDTSIELTGPIWDAIIPALEDATVGVAGPFGLVTDDLKDYREDAGPDVDAIEQYLMVCRRETLREVGLPDERFRFYRLMDLDWSLEFKRSGYRAVVLPELRECLIKHPHREWESLSDDERATKSKKNFDLYYRRRHHAGSLLVAAYDPEQGAPWGHDHEIADDTLREPRFEHPPMEGAGGHTHEHKHWPDHAHTHEHTHEPAERWHQPHTLAHYVPHRHEPTVAKRAKRQPERSATRTSKS